MQIFTIVGARPQFIKLAPVSRAFREFADKESVHIEDTVLHTGQHYDRQMSDIFFEELDIRPPDYHLDVGSGSHGVQTARMLEGIEARLQESKPDVVIVYGDTNSTLAASLAAAKLRLPIAHIEAGLRSFNRDMPEEINRIVADHTADLLFAPTETAMTNLEAENLAQRAQWVGDVMLDSMLWSENVSRALPEIPALGKLAGRDFAILTLHRPGNTDNDGLAGLLEVLNQVAVEQIPIIFPMHPRTKARIYAEFGDWRPADQLQVIEPVGYLEMVNLLRKSRLVLTDSGGLQKEAMFAGVRCVTLREETEWTETVASGCNEVAGTNSVRIAEAVERALGAQPLRESLAHVEGCRAFGGGEASKRIVKAIYERFC